MPIVRAAFPRARAHLGDLVSLGFLRCQAGEPAGVRDLGDAVDGLRPAEGAGEAPDDYLRALNALGSCLAQRGEAAEARRALTESLDASSGRPDDDPYRAFALRVLEGLRRP